MRGPSALADLQRLRADGARGLWVEVQGYESRGDFRLDQADGLAHDEATRTRGCGRPESAPGR